MAKLSRLTGAFLVSAVFVGGALIVSGVQQSGASIDAALGISTPNVPNATGAQASRRPSTPQELASALRMRDRLRALRVLSQTNPRSAALKLLPFLRDPTEQVRADAARELGRLEQPLAERPLAALLAELEEARRAARQGNIVSVRVPPENLMRLALARIRTRQLKGQARLQALSRNIGLTWNDLIGMSKWVNGPERSWMDNTPDDATVQEVVNLLYRMAERGENISSLSAQLKLNPQQQIILKGAPLPTDQEAQYLVDSIARYPGAITGDLDKLAKEHLLNLGSSANTALLRYLSQVKTRPEQYRRRTSSLNFGLLLHTAARTGDNRFLPLFKHFEKVPKPWPQIAVEAKEARQLMEQQQRLLKP